MDGSAGALPGRVVGIDLGRRRIGVAVSDPGAVLATPHAVLERSRARRDDHRAIARLVGDLGARRVVVGVPYSLHGGEGPAAEAATQEVAQLASSLDVPVETCDERFTTVLSERSLRERGVKAREQRSVVDKVAAAVILQGWLDGPRGRALREGDVS